MTLGSSAAFNHSCLATPVDPKSKLPKPEFERMVSANKASDDDIQVTMEEESPSDEGQQHPHSFTEQRTDEDQSLDRESPKSCVLFMEMAREYNPHQYDDDPSRPFYDRLQDLKQENFRHLQELRRQYEDESPVKSHFLAPCCCDEKKVGKENVDEDEQEFQNNVSGDNHEKGTDRSFGVRWRKNRIEEFFTVYSDSEDNDFLMRVEALKKRRKRRVKSAPSAEKRQKTVPQPFQMTIREEQQSAQRRMMLEVLLKTKEAEETKPIMFKAKPVPKHVHEPRFKKIAEKENWTIRGKSYQSQSLMKKSQSQPDLRSTGFRASPFPAKIFTDYAYERMREQDEYRTVKRHIRQKALLESASLPPRMQSSEEKKKYLRDTLHKNIARSRTTSHAKLMPKHRPVPDFDRLYSEFTEAMESKKISRTTTVMQPFSFDRRKSTTKKLSSQQRPQSAGPRISLPHKGLDRKRSTSTASVIHPKEIIFSRSNTANDLRTKVNLKKVEEREAKEAMEEREKFERELREKATRQTPAWDTIGQDIIDHDEIREKLEERIWREKERMMEYKMELEKMQARVRERPTLFEQQSRMNAKQNAERRYKEVLKKEGLSEEELAKAMKEKTKRTRRSQGSLYNKAKKADDSSIISRVDSRSFTVSYASDCESL